MKDLHEDNMFDSIRQRIGGYQEAPSEELWKRIAAAQPKRKPAAAWVYSRIGAVAMLGLLSVLLFIDTDKTKQEAAISDEKKQNEISRIEPIASEPVVIKQKTIRHRDAKDLLHVAEPTVIANHESQITGHESQIADEDSFALKTDSIQSSPKPIEVIPPYKKPKSRIHVYFSLTPSLSFQKIIPTGDDDIIVQGLANRSPFSLKRFGFSIDAGLQYELNKYFGFYGGLSFYRQQQTLTYNYYNNDATVTRVGDSWTFLIDRPLHSRSFDYTMTNLGAQGGVMITLKGEKLKNKFGAGLNYTRSLNSPSSYLAYQVFYRNEIKINDQFSWYVQPMFTYSFITKERLNEPFALKPYRAGITGGVLYRFK
jgi:hypothetical protein